MSSFIECKQCMIDISGMLLFLFIILLLFLGLLCIVNDIQDWVSQGIFYMGVFFGFKLFDDIRGQFLCVQLVLDNVGCGIFEDLEVLGLNELMMVWLMVLDCVDFNLYEWDYYLLIISVLVVGVIVIV